MTVILTAAAMIARSDRVGTATRATNTGGMTARSRTARRTAAGGGTHATKVAITDITTVIVMKGMSTTTTTMDAAKTATVGTIVMIVTAGATSTKSGWWI